MKNCIYKHLIAWLLPTLIYISAEGATVQAELRDSMPESWVLEQSYFQTTPDHDKWWETFDDNVLTSLIKRAVSNNFNVLSAYQRIEMARQTEKITKAGYYPTFGVSAGWGGQQTSGDMQSMKGHNEKISYFNLGLTMNWEIDVFGRIMAQSKADKANYEASVAEYDATMVSLCANVAKAYFQLCMADEEIAVANENILNAEEMLRIAKTRYEVGLVPYVDVLQAEISVMQAKSMLPGLKADVTVAKNQIATLLGEYPEKIPELTGELSLPRAPLPTVTTEPEGLLRRRPDIVQAEKEVAAMAAQVGIAKKDFLPTLSLSAGVGTEAHDLRNLFGGGSLYYSIMPTLSWTIFDGLARNARVNEMKAQLQAQIDSYNLTVMTAVSEVNNAIAQWQSIVEQGVYYNKILNDATKELGLQTDRYRQGLCDFSEVSQALSTVLQYSNSVIESRASQLAAVVALYSALGGGF